MIMDLLKGYKMFNVRLFCFHQKSVKYVIIIIKCVPKLYVIPKIIIV